MCIYKYMHTYIYLCMFCVFISRNYWDPSVVHGAMEPPRACWLMANPTFQTWFQGDLQMTRKHPALVNTSPT